MIKLEMWAFEKPLTIFWVVQEAKWSIIKLSREDLLCVVRNFAKRAVHIVMLVGVYYTNV